MKKGKWQHVHPLHSCINCERFILGWCEIFREDVPTDFQTKTNQCDQWEEAIPWIA